MQFAVMPGAPLPPMPPDFLPTVSHVAGAQAIATATILDDDPNPAGPAAMQSAEGALTFADADVLDFHAATVAPQASGYLGTFTLGALDQEDDSVGWTFEVANADLQHLEGGDTMFQHYDVTLDDGHGGTVVQTVTITLRGVDDIPI
jgi:VCBS repeat-containing protein